MSNPMTLPSVLGATMLVVSCAADHRASEAVDANADVTGTEPDGALGDDAPAGDRLDGGAREGLDAGATSPPDAAADAGDSGRPINSSCDPLILQATPALPEVMIVLDRSQSMAPALPAGVTCENFDFFTENLNCSTGDQAACDRIACLGVDCAQPPYAGTVVCGGSDPSPDLERWAPAVQGLERVIQQFQAELSFGLTLFPGEAGGTGTPGGGGDVCAPGTVRVPSGPGSAAAIAQVLKATQPTGATPLSSTLTAALAHLQARTGTPPRYLLLLTDGQPTCPNAGGNTLNVEALAQDQALALQALDALRAADIETFVFGFIRPSETALATALGELAVHGGTDQFHRVQDAQSIVDQFASIAPSIAASCSVLLEGERDARYLSVELDGLGLEPGADGWLLEGSTLTLQGAACDAFSDGAMHAVVVREWCEPLEP